MSRENVEIKVGVNASSVKTGLNVAKTQLAEFKGELKSMAVGTFAGAAIAGGLIEGFKSLVEEGDKIGDLAERFGISAQGLQRIGNAASQQEGDLDSVAAAMNKLIIAQDKVRGGDKEMAASLAALNINAEDFINLNAEDAFYAIADGVKGAEDRTAAYHSVIEILGKKSGNLFTTLEQGGEAIRKIGGDMGVMSDEALNAFDQMDKNWKKTVQSMKVAASELVTWLSKQWANMGKIGMVLGNKVGIYSDKEFEDYVKAANDAEDDAAARDLGDNKDRARRLVEDKGDGKEEKEREAGEKRILSLTERLAEMKRKAILEELGGQEKIAELVKERAAAELAADAATDPEEKLQKQIKLAESDKELHDARKRADDEAEAKAERIAGKRGQLADRQFQESLDGLTAEQKVKELLAHKSQLDEQAALEPDEEKKIGLEEKATASQREINRLTQELSAVQAPEIIGSHLARSGLGGIAFAAKEVDPAVKAARAAEQALLIHTRAEATLKRIEDGLKNPRWKP